MGSDDIKAALDALTKISIHAPRVGSDGRTTAAGSRGQDFYPRSPRGERLAKDNYTMLDNLFLSTLPAWGATV